MIATHLGIVDEDQINNMSMLFFESVLLELGRKLNYDAVVNYAGNSFCEKSWEIIQKAYPMSDADHQRRSAIADFFSRATVVRTSRKENPGAFGPEE